MGQEAWEDIHLSGLCWSCLAANHLLKHGKHHIGPQEHCWQGPLCTGKDFIREYAHLYRANWPEHYQNIVSAVLLLEQLANIPNKGPASAQKKWLALSQCTTVAYSWTMGQSIDTIFFHLFGKGSCKPFTKWLMKNNIPSNTNRRQQSIP